MALAERDDALRSLSRRRSHPRHWTPAGWIGIGLAAAVAYAAFADGAIALPMEARLQVGIAGLALLTLAALLFAPATRAAADPLAWAGLVTLGVFAVFTGLSFAWSIAPDGTWGE